MKTMDRSAPIPFSEALRTWIRVALLSFGGPAGQIAVMHRIVVEEKRWISEERFLHALNYCMLLPGPEATQLATYIGWLMHRTAGGVMAGLLFILPGIICIMALSYIYAAFLGFFGARAGRPEFAGGGHGGHGAAEGATGDLLGNELPPHTRPSFRRAFGAGVVWLSVWLVPVACLLVFLGPANVFSQIA